MNKRYNELNRRRVNLIKNFSREIKIVLTEMNNIALKLHGSGPKRARIKR